MRAYSVDLRERIVAAVDAGAARPAIARLFQVSEATIKRYLKRRRATGSLVPGRSPGRPPEIPPEQYPALRAQIAAHADDTLAQHCATWQTAQGDSLTIWALRRALRRADITRKQRR